MTRNERCPQAGSWVQPATGIPESAGSWSAAMDFGDRPVRGLARVRWEGLEGRTADTTTGAVLVVSITPGSGWTLGLVSGALLPERSAAQEFLSSALPTMAQLPLRGRERMFRGP